MANPSITSQTGPGTTSWKVVTPHVTQFNCSVAVVVSGTVNYTVNYTYDDVNLTVNPNSANPPISWPLSALSGQTATKDTVMNAPVMAVNLTVNSGSGTATLYVLQAGIRQS